MLLTGTTVAFIHLPGGLMRSSVVLVFLGVVIVTAWIGGVRVASAAAVAAILLVDYWFTHPLYTLNPLAPDMLIFIAATGAAIALTMFAARGFTRTPPATDDGDVAAAVDRTLRRIVGSRRWSAVYQTPAGKMYTVKSPELGELESAQQLADAAQKWSTLAAKNTAA